MVCLFCYMSGIVCDTCWSEPATKSQNYSWWYGSPLIIVKAR